MVDSEPKLKSPRLQTVELPVASGESVGNEYESENDNEMTDDKVLQRLRIIKI